MMNLNLYTQIIPLLLLLSCSQPAPKKLDPEDLLIAKEQVASEHRTEIDGELIKTISFNVTAPIEDYSDGIQPWIRIDSPQVDLSNLIKKSALVILRNKVKIIIDYPLRKEFEFELRSENGFSRESLIKDISRLYHQIYNEEELTATVKTLPIEERTMYNRNQTNGKYGIWGHDIGDLVLTEINVYVTPRKHVILTINVDS